MTETTAPAAVPDATTEDRLDFVAANGFPFRVVYLTDADPARSYVKFYDRRYAFTPDGQFTGGEFYVSTLLEGPTGRGLSLHGGEPSWTLDAETVRVVTEWVAARSALLP